MLPFSQPATGNQIQLLYRSSGEQSNLFLTLPARSYGCDYLPRISLNVNLVKNFGVVNNKPEHISHDT